MLLDWNLWPVSVRCLHVSKCKHENNFSRIKRAWGLGCFFGFFWVFLHILPATENLNFVFRL